MRPCVFLVADETMRETFDAFLSRNGKHFSLGCRNFAFDPKEDLIVAIGKYDSGVYDCAHEYLAPYLETHEHAVAVFDRKYGTDRTADESRDHVIEEMLQSGWPRERFEVVVIDPELEMWLWTGTPHVKAAFRCQEEPREWLAANNWWPAEAPKPPRPKKAAEALVAHGGQRRFNKTLHREIVAKSSVANCVDPAFGILRDALQRWFPPEWQQ